MTVVILMKTGVSFWEDVLTPGWDHVLWSEYAILILLDARIRR